jgi:hypothetical protein
MTFASSHEALSAVGGTQELRNEFQLGPVRLTCRHYSFTDRGVPLWPIGAEPVWTINCEAPVDLSGQKFSASFVGRRDEIPAFYKILEGVTDVP